MLFQFLNDLDDKYGSQRSQLLLMTPLSSVESAYSLIQQEESQREILDIGHVEIESIAPYSRNDKVEGCTECGHEGHNKDKCWLVIGYPSWHPKAKKFPQKKLNKIQGSKGQFKGKSKGRMAAIANVG